MSVLVIGSLIVDNTIYVKSLPQPGETIFAKSSLISHGGKGANQALAVHLSGGEVNLMGCVGGDSVGEEYKKILTRERRWFRLFDDKPHQPNRVSFYHS